MTNSSSGEDRVSAARESEETCAKSMASGVHKLSSRMCELNWFFAKLEKFKGS